MEKSSIITAGNWKPLGITLIVLSIAAIIYFNCNATRCLHIDNVSTMENNATIKRPENYYDHRKIVELSKSNKAMSDELIQLIGRNPNCDLQGDENIRLFVRLHHYRPINAKDQDGLPINDAKMIRLMGWRMEDRPSPLGSVYIVGMIWYDDGEAEILDGLLS